MSNLTFIFHIRTVKVLTFCAVALLTAGPPDRTRQHVGKSGKTQICARAYVWHVNCYWNMHPFIRSSINSASLAKFSCLPDLFSAKCKTCCLANACPLLTPLCVFSHKKLFTRRCFISDWLSTAWNQYGNFYNLRFVLIGLPHFNM